MPPDNPAVTTESPAPTAAAPAAARQRFMALLHEALAGHGVQRLVLSGYQGSEPGLLRIQARPVLLRGMPCLSCVHRYQTRDETRNLAHDEVAVQVEAWLDAGFHNAQLTTTSQDIQLACSRKGRWSLRIGRTEAPAAAPPAAHNREKHRLVDPRRPFLQALGVTDARHEVVPAMARKWKQINKFVEIFSHALAESPLAQAEQVRVMDFGSGKGYLTFAVHDHLTSVLGKQAAVTGVELRPDMVRLCSEAADGLRLQGLRFVEGDVRTFAAQPLDVMIALHACDIATDYAIHMGIRAGAAIIMCSPCCHKQVRPQLLSPHPLRPILQHGIHLGQQAEMLTDGLRALLLEAAGYDTQVFEFISLEHTNKNKMILAVRRAQGISAQRRAELLQQIGEIKAFYGIREQCLESLLQADAA